MMSSYLPSVLQIELLSDATFSRGEGTAGQVDTEVEHDKFGMPFIGGRTVRGLLRDSWLSMCTHFTGLNEAAERILGRSQALNESCRLRIGDAVLPASMRSTIRAAAERTEHKLVPEAILAGFTAVRYQTAEDRMTGAPEKTTLRSSRVVLRGFRLESHISWLNGHMPDAADLRVLALCALATRHGGLLRNRGRGHLRVTLDGDVERTRKYAGTTT
jgi:hypothetical protein